MNHAIARRKTELESFAAPLTIDPAELDAFWNAALEDYADKPLDIRREPAESPFPGVAVNHLTYKGYDDTPIHCWFMVPAAGRNEANASVSAAPLPCVVVFPGYTDDRGYPERHASWLLQGYAVLAVDVRGQGGETGNHLPLRGGAVKGWVSGNVTEPLSSYYHAVTIDAVRAIDAAAAQPETDASKLAVVGGSQGGGLALISAALNPKATAIVADIPNLCHMDFGILNSNSSLTELAHYAKRYPERLDDVLRTIARYDMLNLAPRIKVPVLISVGWKDPVCMPETIYAVYNRIAADKTIKDYPFSGHEVSEAQNRERILFLREQFR
ncbi:acetylxylan esterase [Paenibacillus sacheonensis]|uniref:Alpha/beta fold hydrolase n=1 Tax=Paenibacillus sacheonensis TaxID=742054 RepID=A0A7X5C071_9BACL|nr:alpha/beta fold hydrolase [Paenibacillus sacheonensis]MBM7567631.1 cephalosporin-C deacetylase [Paenibacillus sacheonensis]NBC71266.1 alpha/beta fold hydrolase [Paenibacillus sacheonensis]